MTVLVLDCGLLGEALSRAGDEDVIVVDLHAARLEELERQTRDPRAFFLIGEPAVLPLPDGWADRAIGDGVEPELSRVLKR